MAVYLVSMRLRTTDPAEMRLYEESAVAPDAKYHAVFGEHEILEGPDHEGVVVLEFADVETAKAWYYSDAYQAARAHRLKGAEYSMTLVQGWTPEQALNRKRD